MAIAYLPLPGQRAILVPQRPRAHTYTADMGLMQRIGEKGGDTSRLKWVGGGFVLGFLWGSLMWLITGMQGGAMLWFYLSITMAMIGAGIAAIFGAMNARKRGERISPRMTTKDEAAAKAKVKAAKKAQKGE